MLHNRSTYRGTLPKIISIKRNNNRIWSYYNEKRRQIDEFLMNNKYILQFKKNITIIIFYIIISIYIILYLCRYSINDQAYFYTLSTIPQALSALIGIIGGFIIYRLQLVRTEKSENIRQLIDFVSKEGLMYKFPDLDIHLSDDQLIKILDIVQKEIKGEGSTQSEIRKIALKIMGNQLESKMYSLHFSFPFRTGAFVIIISIFLLSLGQITLPEKSIFPIFNITIIVVGVVVALSILVVLSITESLIMIFETND